MDSVEEQESTCKEGGKGDKASLEALEKQVASLRKQVASCQKTADKAIDLIEAIERCLTKLTNLVEANHNPPQVACSAPVRIPVQQVQQQAGMLGAMAMGTHQVLCDLLTTQQRGQ